MGTFFGFYTAVESLQDVLLSIEQSARVFQGSTVSMATLDQIMQQNQDADEQLAEDVKRDREVAEAQAALRECDAQQRELAQARAALAEAERSAGAEQVSSLNDKVREAEQAGEALSKDLDMQTEAMRRERSMWLERIGAAENDRKLLFGEAQEVEHAMRKEKERMHEAQADAGRYREIFKGQM